MHCSSLSCNLGNQSHSIGLIFTVQGGQGGRYPSSYPFPFGAHGDDSSVYCPDELAWESTCADVMALGHTAHQTVSEDCGDPEAEGLEKFPGLAPGRANSVAITKGMHWQLLIRKAKWALISLLGSPLCLQCGGGITGVCPFPCSIMNRQTVRTRGAAGGILRVTSTSPAIF